MKKYYTLILLPLLYFFSGCNNSVYHDTGLSQQAYNGNMLEYLKSDPGHWDSLVMMIHRAELEPLFEGKNPDYPQITLFGCTNHSILKYLYENLDEQGNMIYSKVDDIPVDKCKKLILSYIIPGRHMLYDFEYEILVLQDNGDYLSTAGTFQKTLMQDSVRIYRIRTPYDGIPDIGPDQLAFQFNKSGHIGEIASCNIQCHNGVIHSFYSDFTMTENIGIDETE